MALNPGDLRMTISPSDRFSDNIACVVGRQSSFNIELSNLSTTDPIYNLSLELRFPDGISFVSANLIPHTNTVTTNFQNDVTFVNIKDLYPNELAYKLNITIQVNETFRSNGAIVPYNYVFQGIQIIATGESTPRGSLDAGNVTITAEDTTTITAIRYAVRATGPLKYIKGAGQTTGASVDAAAIFDMTLEFTNSTRDSSTVSFLMNLANGFRYIGVWTATGTDGAVFNNPTVSFPSLGQDFVRVSLTNKILSPGSTTIVVFQIAIWNNYTLNGIENSGAFIENNSVLESNMILTGNSTSYSTEFFVTAADCIIALASDSDYTDATVLNEYTLTYSVCEYFSISNVTLYFIIPDGMTYTENAATLTPNSIVYENNSTILSWNLGTLPANAEGLIKVFTTTNTNYAGGNPIYSTDLFTNIYDITFNVPYTEELIEDTTALTLTSLPPTIFINLDGYFYSDFTPKPFDIAAIGDYVKFTLVYDASNVVATQRNVRIFNYPPYAMPIAQVVDLTTEGDVPPGITFQSMPLNGAVAICGDVEGETSFSISGYIPVVEGLNDEMLFSLAKCQLRNTENFSYSLRDSSIVYFGIPHLQITSSQTSEQNCISLNDSFTYNIIINNLETDEEHYVVDAFNINFTALVPDVYEILSPPVVTGTGTHGELSVVNNNYSMPISQLAPGDTLTISTSVRVNSLPVMGAPYNFAAAITNGTSQVSPDSTPYNNNQFPLDTTLNTNGCRPTITKVYTPSTVYLFQEYLVTITVNYPAGCIAYNTKIKDSLISTDNSNFRNILLNGVTPAVYSLVTNNLTVPISDVLNTADGAQTYVLTYNDTVTTASFVNNQQIRTTVVSTDWSDNITIPENFSEATTGTLRIVTPALTAFKEQNNETQSVSYDFLPINYSANNILNYRITLDNVGQGDAFNVVFTDTLPEGLNYLSNNVSGTFNPVTRVFSAAIPNIGVGDNVEVIIRSQAANDNNTLTDSASASYNISSSPSSPTLTAGSNTVLAYNFDNLDIIQKLQRNITMGMTDFVTTPISAYFGQSVQYRVVIRNPFDVTMNNIVVTDTFPEELTFVSFEEFPAGTLEVNGNVVTATIASLPPNSAVEYVYTLTLNNELLRVVSSSAVIQFSLEDSENEYTVQSNTVFLRLAALGKGFLIY